MILPPCQPCALEPKPNERQSRPQDARLQEPRAELVTRDEVLLGMQMGWLILAAVYDVRRVDR